MKAKNIMHSIRKVLTTAQGTLKSVCSVKTDHPFTAELSSSASASLLSEIADSGFSSESTRVTIVNRTAMPAVFPQTSSIPCAKDPIPYPMIFSSPFPMVMSELPTLSVRPIFARLAE